jgi:hypothetical protein
MQADTQGEQMMSDCAQREQMTNDPVMDDPGEFVRGRLIEIYGDTAVHCGIKMGLCWRRHRNVCQWTEDGVKNCNGINDKVPPGYASDNNTIWVDKLVLRKKGMGSR